MSRTRRYRALITLLVAPLLAIALLIALVPFARQSLEGPSFYLSVTAICLLLVPALLFLFVLVPIVIHELGHLLAARLLGLTVVTFAAGPIVFYRRPEGVTTAFLPGWLELQGFVWAHPTDTANLRRRLSVFSAAGPAASAAAGLLLLAPGPFLQAVGFLSVFGALSLIPYGGPVGSDGYQLLQLLRHREPPDAGSDWADLFESDYAPGQWPMALFIAQAFMSEGTHREGRAYLYAYTMALEKGRPRLARKFITHAVEHCASVHPDRLHEELAFVSALLLERSAANAALASATGIGTAPYLRAASAIAHLEGSAEESARLREDAYAALSRAEYPPGLHMVEEAMLRRLDLFLCLRLAAPERHEPSGQARGTEGGR